jgi:hypothetical protein
MGIPITKILFIIIVISLIQIIILGAANIQGKTVKGFQYWEEKL